MNLEKLEDISKIPSYYLSNTKKEVQNFDHSLSDHELKQLIINSSDDDSDMEDVEGLEDLEKNEDELEYNYEKDLLVVNDIMILDDTVFADENDNISNETDEVSDIEIQNNDLNYSTNDLVSIILDYDLENENNNILDTENNSNLCFENLHHEDMFLNGSGSLKFESNDDFENRVNHCLESDDYNLEDGNNDVEIEDDLNINNDNCNIKKKKSQNLY